MFGERAAVVAGDGDGDEFRRNRRRFFQAGDAFRRVAAAREGKEEAVCIARQFARRLGDQVGAGGSKAMCAAVALDGGGEDVADVGGCSGAAEGDGRTRVVQGGVQAAFQRRIGSGEQCRDFLPAVALLMDFAPGCGCAAAGEPVGFFAK